MKKLLVLSILIATPTIAQETPKPPMTNLTQDKFTPPKPIDPNTVITLTYGELSTIIQSAVAEAKASGAMAKIQSQLAPKKED